MSAFTGTINLVGKEPLIVLKYHKGKMLGRFICFWGPVMFLCVMMIQSALLKDSLIMLLVFSVIFVGSLLYWIVILQTKEFRLYNNCIVKRTLLLKETSYELNDATYSNYTLWPREFIGITSQNQKKNLVIFYGFIRRSDMKLFYNTLSQLTGETPEVLDRGCNLHLKSI